ncbi:MAG: hypothetical protein IPF92_13855 [Myxococcales bacterium]|nr:hypothetical protein [Myxococcales bacterium]MBL0194959.1 hypothetical protein [Myxococcales bacterium]HQY61056.1 hypothetical protein [Polyangiaceae bacterium]
MKTRYALAIALAASIATALAACGGTTSVADDGGTTPADASTDATSATDAPDTAPPPVDASPVDGSPEGGDASTCVQAPTVGTPCTSGQKSCDKIDGCCLPQVVCDATKGTWELLQLRCPCQTVPCGSSTCPGTQYCQAQASGVDGGGTSYACMDYPKACERQWTCACVQANGPARCAASPARCVEQSGRPFLTCGGQ